MQKRSLRFFLRTFASFALIAALIPVAAPAHLAQAPGAIQPGSASSAAYLELRVDPPFAVPGSLVTLHITYHNIGEVYAYFLVTPPDLVLLEPPLDIPCKFYEHPSGCQLITIRALANGVVTISATATGEVWDAGCPCWYMGGATSAAPARLVITDHVWSLFLPVIRD